MAVITFRVTKTGIIYALVISFICILIVRNHNNADIAKSMREKQYETPPTEDDIRILENELLDSGETASPDDVTRKQKMNVLFMITDDMRPQLGCYSGKDYANPTIQQKMHTPHLDRLAKKSLLLRRAYCQYSLCGPSRASMMTSRRPDTTRIYGNNLYWRNVAGNFTTLPQYFKEKGYTTIGIGKIYHQFESSNNQDPISWSEHHFEPRYSDDKFYGLPSAGYKAVTKQQRKEVMPLTDEHSMIHARKRLREIARDARSGEKPFFMAVGFCKPHLNFVCGKEYFDQYRLESGKQYLSEKSWQTPVVSQYCNMANVTERRGVRFITDRGLRHLRHAYFSCISFVDSMVGDLLDELNNLGLSETTIVSFVADHGHHLGENGYWGKQTNHEIATHIPMMIHVPGKTDKGVVSRSLVEGVDLYPTIVEAAGFDPVPKCPKNSFNISVCTEGRSMLPLMKDPDGPWKKAAFTQIRNMYNLMTYAIRTDRYRYVAKVKINKKQQDDGKDKYVMDWNVNNEEYWTELYDLEIDPEERINRTEHRDYSKIKTILEKKLHSYVNDVEDVPRIK